MFSFGQSAALRIELDDTENRPYEKIHTGSDVTKRYIYTDGETVRGKLYISLKKPGRKLEHKGISVTFVAIVDVHVDSATFPPFLHEFKCLAQPGFIDQDQVLPFEFKNQRKPCETFYGTTLSIRYIIVGRIMRSMSEIKVPYYLSVYTYSISPKVSNTYYTEIGLKKCILMDLELNKLDFHLKDVIIGRVTWKLVNLPIKKMELVIERHEIVFDNGFEDEYVSHIEDVAVYELLDGNPSKGDTIPFRIFLEGVKLTPTIDVVNDKVAVSYFVYISAFDESGRRYFKREQIRVWRKLDHSTQRFNINYNMAHHVGREGQNYDATQNAITIPPFP